MAVHYHDVGENHIAAIGDHTKIFDERLIGRPDVIALLGNFNARAEYEKLTGEAEEKILCNIAGRLTRATTVIMAINAGSHGVILQYGRLSERPTGVVGQPLVAGEHEVSVEHCHK